MANKRGRPRKVEELQDFAAQPIAEPINVVEVTVDADYQPTLHKLTPTATRGGFYRRNDLENTEFVANPKRLEQAIAIIERIKLHGGSWQEHNNCLTVTLGRYSECINITSPDRELEKLVNRVIYAGA